MRPSSDPLVLLHGLGMPPRAWAGVRPLLARRNDVVALALPGHRGGAAPGRRPVRVAALVDAVELALDELGLERPHIAGNSLGAWIAIELARRGRARTVCALAPAGSWTAGGAGQRSGARRIRRLVRSARLGGRIPWALRSPAVRRLALRDVAAHGERLRAQEAVEATRDLLACTVFDDVLTTPEAFAPLDPL